MFKSDNASALDKIRGFVSDQATMKGIQLEIDADVAPTVTSNLMKRLEPQIRSVVERKKREELAKAIKEAATSQMARDPDDRWMSGEFRAIIQSVESDEASGCKTTDLLKEIHGKYFAAYTHINCMSYMWYFPVIQSF